ncbi:MAG: nitroreductase family protein [Candidatus Saliniplasma sp.]
MEFIEVVKKRRSVRQFKERDIPEGDVKKILRIGHMAPSAGNLQGRDFVVVREEEEKEKLSRNAYSQAFIAEAPWVVVVCANKRRSGRKYGERGEELYSVQDATAAVQNMLLAIEDLEYASVWIGAFDEEAVSQQLQLPSHIRPVAILPIGYRAVEPDKPDKIDVEDITHHERW